MRERNREKVIERESFSSEENKNSKTWQTKCKSKLELKEKRVSVELVTWPGADARSADAASGAIDVS